MKRLFTTQPLSILLAQTALCIAILTRSANAQAPVLDTLFPAGAQIGTVVEVEAGGRMKDVRSLLCNADGVRCERIVENRFRLTIPAQLAPGQYDVWAVGDHGVSAARTFWIGNRAERLEAEANDSIATCEQVSLDTTVNGRIEKAGDADHYRFEAKQGQRVVIECLAERIDSRLRAVLELFNHTGQRLAVNRGYFGIDPLIDFRVPTDGEYIIKIHDLTQSAGADYYYRLDIDTQHRVAFSHPTVVERGKAARVTLFGWNLSKVSSASGDSSSNAGFDRVDIDLPSSHNQADQVRLVPMNPAQAILDGFAFHHPGSHAPVFIGLTDVPVVIDGGDNHRADVAQEIAIPCEVSGQLTAGNERDWYSIRVHRGDVLNIEAIGQRLQSPVDLQIGIFDSTGEKELIQFGDEIQNSSTVLSTAHLDPAGRWVAPADGLYLIAIRNLFAGTQPDPRRVYRLSVRREEPDFQVLAVPRRSDPAGLNVRRGGREVLELIAFRRRGMHEAIRVSAKNVPTGIECPDVWLGPDVNRATLVVSADTRTEAGLSELKLEADCPGIGRRIVRGATIVRTGTANPWARLVSQIPLAIADEAALRIRTDGDEEMTHHLYGKLKARHSPGSVLDIAVQVERPATGHQASVRLTGIGVPDAITNQTAIIPAGEQKGYISFWLPPTLALGRYSFVVRGETTVPAADGKTETIVVYSDPVNFQVQSSAFSVEVDPFAVTRAKRGETIQIAYSALRQNGFIGKMHTELAMPGKITDVVGLRGRGETFVGQTDKGSLQIIVNDDAPLGRREFLRLFTVGVVEDQPIYQGSCLLPLEITE